MDTGSPPRYRTQTYQLLSIHNPTRSLSRNAGLSVSYTNYQNCRLDDIIVVKNYVSVMLFTFGETCHSLSDRMNGHHFTTTLWNSELSLAIHTQSHHSLSRNAGLLVSYTNYLTPPQTTYATNLKLHTNLSSNPDTPPVSTSVNPPQIPPSPQRHLKFRLSLIYSTAGEGHSDLAESKSALSPLPFLFVSPVTKINMALKT